MNWLTKAIGLGEKIKKNLQKKFPSKSDIESSAWTALNCCSAGPKLKSELEDNLMVCPNCSTHHYINPRERFDMHFGKNNWQEIKAPIPEDDPLQWSDSKPYKERLKEARKKTGQSCAVLSCKTQIDGIEIVVSAIDFRFIGGSIASAEGENILQAAQTAIDNKPLLKPYLIKWQPRFIYAFMLAFILLIPTTIRYLNTTKIVAEFGMTNKNIMLSDGTNVQLNAGSTLSYSKDYNSGSREVFLNGEAYFNVTKNHVPFIVSTDYAQITVLGTKFNVRSRSDGFEAGVNEGSVEVTNNDKSIVLIEGERALIHSTSHSNIDSSSTSNYYPGWLNNKIVCDNTPLEKICKEIERTYNIKISQLD